MLRPKALMAPIGNSELHPSPCLALYSCVCPRSKNGSGDRRSASESASASQINETRPHDVPSPPTSPHSKC